MSKEENWPGNGDAYNNSKLVALYGIREISKLAMDSNTKRSVYAMLTAKEPS
jgi:hypothetical protein